MRDSGADARLLRANEELRRVLNVVDHPSARLLPRHVYEAFERRAQRWSRVVEFLISEPADGDGRASRGGGRDAA